MRTMTSASPTQNETGAERIARRLAFRQQSIDEAMSAHKAANERLRGEHDIVSEVDAARKRLTPLNVAMSMEVIEAASDHERDILLIAEETGKNRKGMLQHFPPAQRVVKAAYEAALAQRVGQEAPEQSESALD